jgi:hypothetical protein
VDRLRFYVGSNRFDSIPVAYTVDNELENCRKDNQRANPFEVEIFDLGLLEESSGLNSECPLQKRGRKAFEHLRRRARQQDILR